MAETEAWERPSLPPKPRNPGLLVARFNAYLPSTPFGYSRDNHLLVRLAVDPTEEWKARLLSESAGKELYVEVRAREVSTDDAVAALIAAAEEMS
jgi:hypothetical protein